MNKKKTYIINLVAGPGVGKSTIAADIFVKLKKKKFVTEIVLEKAKELVWKEDFELLNNQYLVSKIQNDLFMMYKGKVDFVVTDGSLLHGLVFNKINKDNISNILKTENAIIKWFQSHKNITIYLERNIKIPFENAGRLQKLESSQEIDKLLIEDLIKFNLKYKSIKTNSKTTKKCIKYILKEIKRTK